MTAIVLAMLAAIVVTSIAFRFVLLQLARRERQYRLALLFIAERHPGAFSHLFAAKVLEGRISDLEKAFPDYFDWCGLRVRDEEAEQMP